MSRAIEDLRAKARAVFAEAGLPSPRMESWKYTDVRRAMRPFLQRLEEAARVDEVDVDALEALAAERAIAHLDAYRIVLIDGRVHAGASDLPGGVEISSLAGLLESKPKQGAEWLAFDENEPLFNGFIALNTAHAKDGVGVCIADGVRLDKPLYLQHINTGNVAHIRHGIHLGEHAEACVIEHYIGAEDAVVGFTNVVSIARLLPGSRLDHIRLQQESSKQTHIGRLSAWQHRDSHFRSYSIALGAALSRVDIVAGLREPGAVCELKGLYLTNGRQHADHHTVIDHQAPHCLSREMYRGVLDGHSRAVFNGRVVVHRGAVKSDSAQSNANLLLSTKAEVDAKPELEIYNDDVKCAHGATVGQLDADQLFYLQSRGLSEDEARQLLTFAFADETLAGMEVAAVRRYIERAAFSKLPHDAEMEAALAGGKVWESSR